MYDDRRINWLYCNFRFIFLLNSTLEIEIGRNPVKIHRSLNTSNSYYSVVAPDSGAKTAGFFVRRAGKSSTKHADWSTTTLYAYWRTEKEEKVINSWNIKLQRYYILRHLTVLTSAPNRQSIIYFSAAKQ